MSWIEAAGFALALAMVGCNIREIHWGWPLAIASSILYYFVFWDARLYGDAVLQVFFAAVALWGWFQWLRGRRDDGSSLRPVRLTSRGIAATVGACALLWPATGWFLDTYTDTDVPWWDAFPTSVSLVGQFLLGRKFIENWLVWIVVNAVSVGLFIYKDLLLTAVLYVIFIALSVVGFRAWRGKLHAE
jgi:nicotinamide mononucleotide transporter